MSKGKKSAKSRVAQKHFGLLIGLAVFILFLLIGMFTDVFQILEIQILDAHYKLKRTWLISNRTASYATITSSPKLSKDIVIIGVDNRTLEQFGKWPFPRSVHADLLNTFARIKQSEERERAVLLDFLFNDISDPAYEDVLLLEAMRNHGRTSLQTAHSQSPLATTDQEDLTNRFRLLLSRFGEVEDVSGNLSKVSPYYSIESPLIPYERVIAGYGHASYTPDADETYRRVELVSRYALKVEEVLLDELSVNTDFGISGRGHLSWVNNKGEFEIQNLPLSEDSLNTLKKDVRQRGLTKQIVDADTQLRSESYILTAYEDYYIPAITLLLALRYLNVELQDIEVVYGSHILIPSPRKWNAASASWVPYTVPAHTLPKAPLRELEEIRVPIDESGNMLINFMGGKSSSNPSEYQTFPVRSYSRFAADPPSLDTESWPDTRGLGGKIVLVGAFSLGMADDEKPTPRGLMFGVEMHANALNTIIMDNFIIQPSVLANGLILFIVLMLFSFISFRMKALGWASVILLGFILFSFIIVTSLFNVLGILVDWGTPILAILVAFIAIVIFRFLSAERDKKQIKGVFGQFISPALVEDLVLAPPELGGVYIDGTVLFSDIRNFTGLAGSLSSGELVDLLNRYLTAMTDSMVIDYKGTLDKYIGDAIMSFWGAPKADENHALNACKSALAQMRILKRLNPMLQKEFQRRIDIGIGINSAFKDDNSLMVAYMGSEGRKNYTAMGDAVNLASRLEGVNKTYHTSILLSEDTYKLIRDDELFIVRELDVIRVKGRRKPVTIYELVDYEGELKGVPGDVG